MDWVTNNPGQALMTLGILLLVIEMLVMGFSTFLLTFFGLSAIVTGAAVYFGIIPSDLLTVVICSTIVAMIFAVVLWRPLKRFQNTKESATVKNDIIGLEFTLASTISHTESGSHRLSGVNWVVKSQHTISAGTDVIVEKTDVGTLWVVAKTQPE